METSSTTKPTIALTYACPACAKSFAATVTVPHDPKELISERDRTRLRTVRAMRKEAAEQLQQITPDLDLDPVDETENELLESMGVGELEFATCPGCDERNPVGVAKVRTERRASRAGVAGFYALAALAAWFAPWVAFVVPVMGALILGVAVMAFRKIRQPIPWARLGLQAVVPMALGIVPYAWPRWAFVVPLACSGLSLVQESPGDDERFARARERIRFHGSPYREPS